MGLSVVGPERCIREGSWPSSPRNWKAPSPCASRRRRSPRFGRRRKPQRRSLRRLRPHRPRHLSLIHI
ncbi:hypothetical protein BSZ18_00015, partial [Bradyrhizobium canariense]